MNSLGSNILYVSDGETCSLPDPGVANGGRHVWKYPYVQPPLLASTMAGALLYNMPNLR